MLTFDPKGFLVPDRVISSSLEELQTVFVKERSDETRSQLFDNFLHFCRKLLADLNLSEVRAWVNGSFTTRKRNPNDIDIVLHLPFETLQRYEALLRTEYDNKHVLASLRLDVYIVAVFPEGHPSNFLTRSDQAYWVEKFTKTRPDNRRIVYKKGILELNINANEIR